ncbi:HIRAN domain-containing protein [Pseudogulbenkiania subflava]|uniref:Group I intron endonuclease n=1 Tax=Pseudogulbenkiania subflava DSM 22618 TaxID=1123014 RepID=A0A1Y6C9V6_9NEIS|nr:HIRAN domain-containing protein [Pseudogulbenkiania subflava]SMF53297.1 group I intron endonuclease [Pseudogulbenkiania subflava DSM 22618]
MRISANISVKGTKYYKAAELLQRGALSTGTAIRLEHQPDNLHDKNAVAVKIMRTGTMLGHVSRELAPKYAALINGNKIIEAGIANAEKNGKYINIDIRVVYEQSDEQLAQRHASRLWQSALVMPAEAGVYTIWNIDSGRQYIGSSTNIKDRIRAHMRDLTLGCHANHALQSDFTRLGAEHFEAKILERVVPPSKLAMAEAQRISSLLNSGAALYNLTDDGQGKGRSGRGYTEPISDRLARQRAEEEQREIDEIFSKKRKAVIDDYAPKFTATLPKTNFWVYFAAAFVGIFIALAIMIPKISEGRLFVFSFILAFVVSPFVSGYFQGKAKQSAEYQNLTKQRDEKLRAIDNEHNKMRGL